MNFFIAMLFLFLVFVFFLSTSFLLARGIYPDLRVDTDLLGLVAFSSGLSLLPVGSTINAMIKRDRY